MGGSTSPGSGGLVGAAGSSLGPDTSQWMLPLAVGRSWTYTLTPLDEGQEASCEPLTSQVLQAGWVQSPDDNAEQVFGWIYQSSCSTSGYLLWEDAGTLRAKQMVDVTDPSQGLKGEPLTFLVDPEVALSWTYVGDSSYTWTSVGTATVAAGTFTDCWERRYSASELTSVYCRGVGMVSMRHLETNTSLELASMVIP